MRYQEEVVASLVKLGKVLNGFVSDKKNNPGYNDILREAAGKAELQNPFFTQENILKSFQGIVVYLNEKALKEWIQPYFITEPKQKAVGVIMAGNIPMPGFHDFLSVLVSGHKFVGKLSSKDSYLLAALTEILLDINPNLKDFITFTENNLTNIDAVIATGSNNSARYFDYYFKKYPHIIRKNRNSIALLSGNETDDELKALGEDIFSYFGLGCRSVSKIYIPEKFELDRFFKNIVPYSEVINHHKYGNNYDYWRTVYMMNKISFLENGFIITKEDSGLSSPISVLFYEYYQSINDVKSQIELMKDELQCVVSNEDVFNRVDFGKAQYPKLTDYADNINTLSFLKEL